MARIKLKLPSTALAAISIPVRITDLNYGGHVGNDAIVSIVHEARVQFLALHDMTELGAGGTGLIMNELAIEYKNESFYKDTLIVQIYCGDFTKVSFELYYKLSCKRENREVVIATAKTGMVCYSYDKKAPEPITEMLKLALGIS